MASTKALWASLAAGAASMTAILTGAHAIAPYLASDAAPLAGIARVDDAVVKVVKMFNDRANATDAGVVKGQILGASSRLCDAVRAKNLALGEIYAAQLSDLQLDYMKLTGLTFPLRQCL